MDFSKVKEWQIPEGNVASVSVGGVVIWQAKTQAEQLTAPTISLDGDILTMTATDDRTQEFVIFVDGVETATAANLISFSVEGNGYQALAGMTWDEWVESAFNTGGWYKCDYDIICKDDNTYMYTLTYDDGMCIHPNDIITTRMYHTHREPREPS